MKETTHELPGAPGHRTVYMIDGKPYTEFMEWKKTETGYSITTGYRPLKIVKTRRLTKGEELAVPWN